MNRNPLERDPERETRVRERAYKLWEEDGRPHGRDVEFWERARLQIGMEENPTAGQIPVKVPELAKTEEAELQANLGEFPGQTDQGDRAQTPAPRNRRRTRV